MLRELFGIGSVLVNLPVELLELLLGGSFVSSELLLCRFFGSGKFLTACFSLGLLLFVVVNFLI